MGFCVHTNLGGESSIYRVFLILPSYASCVCLSSFLPTSKFINMGNTELIGCNTSILEIRLLLSTTCSGTNPSSFSPCSFHFSLSLIKAPQNYLRKQELQKSNFKDCVHGQSHSRGGQSSMEAMGALTGCRDVPTWKRLLNWRMKPSNLFILCMNMYFAYAVQQCPFQLGLVMLCWSSSYVMLIS